MRRGANESDDDSDSDSDDEHDFDLIIVTGETTSSGETSESGEHPRNRRRGGTWKEALTSKGAGRNQRGRQRKNGRVSEAPMNNGDKHKKNLLALLASAEDDSSSSDDDGPNTLTLHIPANKMTPEVMKYLGHIKKSAGSAPIEKEINFFVNQERRDQKTFLKLLENNEAQNAQQMPVRFRILRSNLPDPVKRIALARVEAMFTPMGAMFDNDKAKQWVDNLLQVPFGQHQPIPISKRQSPFKITRFLQQASTKLNASLYGQNKAKEQILQYIGQLISNPTANGTSIALVGPPGVGKTSIIREGFSKILKRPFSLISLGGASDSSTLIGHGQTQEGSQQGKIVESLVSTNCMNPVIYFDELDKVSNTTKGEEVYSVLTHLTDSAQNDNFQDRYFSGVPINLNRALFVFSLNDITKINPILKDRIHIIEVDGQNSKEKEEIATGFLIPKRLADFGLTPDQMEFTPEVVKALVERHRDEKGVRGLSASIRELISRLNLVKLLKSGKKSPKDVNAAMDILSQADIEVADCTRVTVEVLNKVLPEIHKNNPAAHMYI